MLLANIQKGKIKVLYFFNSKSYTNSKLWSNLLSVSLSEQRVFHCFFTEEQETASSITAAKVGI